MFGDYDEYVLDYIIMELESKIYLSKEGLKKLKKELQVLKSKKELKTKEGASSIPSQSIDSEYANFQEDLNFLEARIEEIETILKKSLIIKKPPVHKRKIIYLGATVTIEVDHQEDEFTIVGSIEANPVLGKISNESPVGMALIGHSEGDAVKVQSAITTVYKIKKITYKI